MSRSLLSRFLLIGRLAARDLRHRPSEAALLLLAITAAATMLSLGLVLHGTTVGPYQRTRAATAGPDLVATAFPGPNANQPADLAALTRLEKARGVTAHSGPYPATEAALRGGGYLTPAMVEGRDQAEPAVDRPELTAGSWVRPGAVVLERSFAQALGVGVGDKITLNGRGFTVSGIAVSAAVPSYPSVCAIGCDSSSPPLPPGHPGLIWTTRAAARSLVTPAGPLTWFLDLRLASPASADAYATTYDNTNTAATAPYLNSWQHIADADGRQVSTEETVLLVGSWLLGLLAVASVAVLAGGRMADQLRRVGLLKAVGATPGLVALVLLAEHLVLALAAAALGLLIGWLAAPLLTNPGAGLLGSAGPPSLTPSVAGIVFAVALAVAVAATLVPAIRGARTSTVGALAGAARPPKRRAIVTRLSARLPVPLLLGMRLAARRPRRTVLSAASIAVTVAGIVTVLMVHARFDASGPSAYGQLGNPLVNRISQVMTAMTIALIVMAAVNALLITWATVLDARRSSALTRALGSTPGQVSAGLAVAQMLPALAAAIIGIPAGILLYASVKNGSTMTYPPAWWLVSVVVATPLVIGALALVPSRVEARSSVAPILQAETA